MSDDDELEIVREAVARDIAAGFRSRDEVIEEAIELFSDELDAKLLVQCVPQIYDAQLAAHREAQKAWPAITDCDKLDAAFDALNAAGIMARHDWWCCQNCGHAATSAIALPPYSPRPLCGVMASITAGHRGGR